MEKKFSVPLTKIYRLSHLTTNFVPWWIPNRWFLKLKNVEITFFQQKTSFSARKYEWKPPEKIPDFPLGSIYS